MNSASSPCQYTRGRPLFRLFLELCHPDACPQHSAVLPEKVACVQGDTIKHFESLLKRCISSVKPLPCAILCKPGKRNSHKSGYRKHIKVLLFKLDLIQSLMGSHSLSSCFQTTPCLQQRTAGTESHAHDRNLSVNCVMFICLASRAISIEVVLLQEESTREKLFHHSEISS